MSTAAFSGAAIASGLLASAIGSAGIFGTTIGATGITGVLMSAGILSSTPVAVPVIAGGAIVGFCYIFFQIFKLKRRLARAKDGIELQFSENEAKTIENVIKLIAHKENQSKN